MAQSQTHANTFTDTHKLPLGKPGPPRASLTPHLVHICATPTISQNKRRPLPSRCSQSEGGQTGTPVITGSVGTRRRGRGGACEKRVHTGASTRAEHGGVETSGLRSGQGNAGSGQGEPRVRKRGGRVRVRRWRRPGPGPARREPRLQPEARATTG